MQKLTHFALTLLLAAPFAPAQDSVARSAAATRAAAPAATTTPMPAQPRPVTPSVTGVPRYRAGMRGPRGIKAPVTPGTFSITGVGDHTGTGAGTGGPHADALAVPHMRNALGITAGTPIHVHLKTPVNSGNAHNGDILEGTLAAPLGSLPKGTPVRLTVVAAAAAGQMTDVGEISFQIISINGEQVLSNVVTAEGQQSKTILADDAPSRGTEALVTPDMTLELPAA